MNNQQEQQREKQSDPIYQIEHTAGWSDLRPDEVELYKNSNANIRVKPEQLIEKLDQFECPN